MPKIVKNSKDKIRVQQVKPPKMKDKPNRSRMIFNLKETFGFIPEVIIIDKVPNVTNTITISAVMPDKLVKQLEAEEKSKKLKKDAKNGKSNKKRDDKGRGSTPKTSKKEGN